MPFQPSEPGPQDRGQRRHAPFGARAAVMGALRAAEGLLRCARRQGLVDLGAVELCAARLVEQAGNGTEALLWFLRQEPGASLLARRAVGTATIAIVLGRRLGFDTVALRALGAGGLLLDIGKVAVPVPILAKTGVLDGAEAGFVRRHVDVALGLLAGHDLAPRALEMVAGHHERADGNGYPLGLRGSAVPVFARIAGIADAWDAMTLHRRYAPALSPHAALRELQRLAEAKFDVALVADLAAELGDYPVGTAVELADGRLGLVCGQRAGQPATPHVIVTHDARRVPLAAPALADRVDPPGIRRVLVPGALPVESGRLEPALRAFHRAAA